MKFGMTIIYVPNPAETAKFWERAFGSTIRVILKDNSYADLEPRTEEDVSIGFVNSGDFETMYGLDFNNDKLSRTQLMFSSQNVDSDFARAVKHGAMPLLYPHKTDWSERVAYVEDFNGTVVILSGEMNPDLMNREMLYHN